MIIVLTGHQGFIGTELKKYLENLNHTVIGLDIKSGNDILTCLLPECDMVIHLAAVAGVRQSLEDPKKYWDINVDGTRRILEHYNNTRVLVASSSSQYEPHLNPYAASKHVMEQLPHTNVCFMRFHTVYSSTPRAGMFFDKLINNTLEYVTDHYRDFIHVNDVCRAVVLIMKSNTVGPIDVGTGVLTSIKSIRPTLPVNNNTPRERRQTLADTSKLSQLGFIPNHSITDFLKTLT